MTNRNFRVTFEQPRTVEMEQEQDVVVDRFVTYVYGVPNQTAVRERLVGKLKELRKQGLRITKPQMLKADILIERI